MPDKPPPDAEQTEAIREYASQLEYAFRARPDPSADGRQSWERRFIATFSRMLQILAVAKFEYLPPFAIACIWENNRRSHAQEPVFDVELIRDGYDQAHPAYHGQTQLVYQPAYDGRFSTIPEAQLRNVWWSQRPLPPPQALPIPGDEGHGDDSDEGNAGAQQEDAQATQDDEAQVVGDDEEHAGQVDAETEAQVAAQEEADRVDEVMDEVAPPAIEGNEADIEGEARPRSELRRSGHGGRGRSASRAKEDTPAASTRRTTRSASRSRAPTSTVAAASTSKQRASSKAKGKRKATPGDRTIDGQGQGKQAAVGLDDRRAHAGGRLTLKDIMPVEITVKDVAHPRPCDRCVHRGIRCMYNPLVRSTCTPCGRSNYKCNLTFYSRQNHPLATYLGYAWYLMLSHPDIYAAPGFNPTNWPSPPPQKEDFAWFRAQYDAIPRGRPPRGGKKKSVRAADDAQDTPSELEEPLDQSATSGAASANESQHEEPAADTTSVRTTRSRAASAAPSRDPPMQSGTSRPSAARLVKPTSDPVENITIPQHEEDGAEDPSSPTSRSETSSAGMVVDAAGDHDGNFDIDLPQFPDVGGIVGEVDRIAEKVPMPSHTIPGPSSSAPHTRTRRAPPAPVIIDRPTAHTFLRTSRILTELALPSTSRINPPEMPPPPFEARKHARIPFMVKEIVDTWESLPRLGRHLGSGGYALVDPPHEDDTRTRIEALLNIGRSGLEALGGLAEANADPQPPSPSRPITPSSDPFFITDNVARLIENTKAKFEEIQNLHTMIEEDCTLLQDRAHGIMDRHHRFILQSRDGGLAVSEDIRDAYVALTRVLKVLSHFLHAFSVVPTVPWNWMSLLELLTKIEELRELYRISWQRFDVLQEEQRPIRAEIYRLRENVAHVQACLDGIANETVHACEPLIHNLFVHFSTRLEGIEQRLRLLDGGAPIVFGPREPTFGQVLNEVTRLSARMDTLERVVGDPLKTRIEVTIENYLAERGLTDDVIWQLGIDIGHPPQPVPVGGSISDVLHTVYPGQNVSGSAPSSSAGCGQLPSASNSVVPSTLGSSARYTSSTQAPSGVPDGRIPSATTGMQPAAREAGAGTTPNASAPPRRSSRQQGARQAGASSVPGRGGNGGRS